LNESFKESLAKLEIKTGHTFKDPELLRVALTHSSFAHERKINTCKDNERIEFLGDAVLELVSSRFLYENHPDTKEGSLTRQRAALVCEPSLAYCAREIGLGESIMLGHGEELTGGRDRDSVLSDAFEAVIGAIYLDGGIEPAEKFINKTVLHDIEQRELFIDSKTKLQELVQGKNSGSIVYEVVREEGPQHDKVFESAVYIDGKEIARGVGKNKKAAEQNAAFSAVNKIRHGEI